MQSTSRLFTTAPLAGSTMNATVATGPGLSTCDPTASTAPKHATQSACAMARYTTGCTSTSSDVSGILETPVHSSVGMDLSHPIERDREPGLSMSRPASFDSVESLQVLTPQLQLVCTDTLPTAFTDDKHIGERPASPNSIVTLLGAGEATPRAHTPKAPSASSSKSATPSAIHAFDYKASEFVGPQYERHFGPEPSPPPEAKVAETSRILGHDKSTGVTIIDFSDNIAMPRSQPTSRSSSLTSIASKSSSGSTRGHLAQVYTPPAWAQCSDTIAAVEGTYAQLMEKRQAVEREFGNDMFQPRDDDGTQSAVKSVTGRVVVKSDPKRYISVVWLPGLSYVHHHPRLLFGANRQTR